MDSGTEARTDPLAPIEFAVTCISALIALAFAILIPFAIFGNGSVLGLGDKDACAVVDSGIVPFTEMEDQFGGVSGVQGLRGDAFAHPRTVDMCNGEPGPGVKAASVAPGILEVSLLVGFLALTRRLIRSARRHGLFTAAVAGRARTIGWLLLVGGPVVATVDVVSDGIVVDSAVTDVGWSAGLDHYDMPWTLVIAGLGIITVARVLRRAVLLQDDHDATI